MHFDEIRDHEPECIKCNTPMKVFSDGSVIGHRKIYHELADSIGSIHELILICPKSDQKPLRVERFLCGRD
jgi:hypothetical protein